MVEHVLSIEALPEFKTGLACLDDLHLELAAETFGKLYESIVETEGDIGTGVGPIAFAYGDTNLRLAAASNSAMFKRNFEKKIVEDELRKESGGATGKVELEKEEEHVETTAPADQEDIDEMFSIAWESLDVSRVIFQRLSAESTSSEDKHFFTHREARARSKLGELFFEQGVFANALEELELARELFLSLPVKDNDLVSCFLMIGAVLESLSAENPSQVLPLRLKAVHHYVMAQRELRKQIRSPPTLTCTTTTTTSSPSQWKPNVLSPEEEERLNESLREVLAPVVFLEQEDGDESLKEAIEEIAEKVTACVFDFTLENVEVTEEQPVKAAPQSTITEEGEQVVANVLQPRKRVKNSEEA